MNCTLRIISMLLVGLVSTQTCLSQTDPWSHVQVIKPGAKISVRLNSGRSVNGKMDAWRADGMSVRKGSQIVSVEKSSVAEVVLVIGRSRGNKALLAGLIAGGVAGGLTGAACASNNCEDISAAVIPAAAGLWGGIAAGIAALFPPHREVIYSAPSAGAQPARTN